MKTGLIVCVLMAVLIGCKEYERISAQEFKQQYEQRNMQTMHHAEYLGQNDGKAFMRIKSMSSTNQLDWKERIVFCDMSELDPALKRALLSERKAYEPNKQKQ